ERARRARVLARAGRPAGGGADDAAAARRAARARAADRRRRLRARDHRLRALALVPALGRRLHGRRHGRPGERRDAPDRDPARDARRAARPGQRGEPDLHPGLEPARRRARRLRRRGHEPDLRGRDRRDRLPARAGARRLAHSGAAPLPAGYTALLMRAPEPHPFSRDFRWRSPAPPFRRIRAAQARAFDEEGFFVLEDAFDPETVARVTAEIDPIEARVEAFLAGLPDGRLFIARAREITFSTHLVLRSKLLRAFCASPPFADLAADLVGPDVRLYWDQAVYK